MRFTLKSPLFRALLSRLFTSACTTITAFVSLKLYTVFLTKEIYGVIFVSNQIISYLPLTGAGFMGVLNQRILTSRDPETKVETSWFSQFMQSYMFLIALAVATFLMALYGEMPVARSSGLPRSLFLSIGVSAALIFYTTSQISFLIGQGEQVKSYLFQGTLILLTSAFLFLAFVLGLNVWAFPVSTCVTALVLFPAVSFALRQRLPGLPPLFLKPKADYRERFKAIWRPALANLMTQGWSILTFSLDIILIGMMIGPGQAAIYGVISRFTGISRHILQALGETAWPRLAAQSNAELKARFMKKVDRLNAWNVGCWFGAMFATIQPFMVWFLKADWVAGQTLIGVVLLRHAILSLQGPHVFGVVSLGLFKDTARISRNEVIASVIPALLLCHFLGTLGVALGYLIGSAYVSGWQLTRLYFVSNGQPWIPEWCGIYLRFAISGSLSYGLGLLLWQAAQTFGFAPGWMTIPIGAIACIATWAATGGAELMKTHFRPQAN